MPQGSATTARHQGALSAHYRFGPLSARYVPASSYRRPEAGHWKLAATDLEYEVTRVKSPVLGRDLNPMGRGDGTYYCNGGNDVASASVAITRAKAPLVGEVTTGFGNSVNNALPPEPPPVEPPAQPPALPPAGPEYGGNAQCDFNTCCTLLVENYSQSGEAFECDLYELYPYIPKDCLKWARPFSWNRIKVIYYEIHAQECTKIIERGSCTELLGKYMTSKGLVFTYHTGGGIVEKRMVIDYCHQCSLWGEYSLYPAKYLKCCPVAARNFNADIQALRSFHTLKCGPEEERTK